MLAKKDLRDSNEIEFKRFKKYYNKGIDKKENFDNLNKIIEKAEIIKDNNLILDFLFGECFKLEDDLLKYRILKLANWFLYKRQDFKYYQKFKEKIFILLLSSNGNVRYNSTHLVNDLRGHLLSNSNVDLFCFNNPQHKFSEEEKNLMRESQNLLILSFFELINMYEKSKDEKIKKNILKSIEHYYCYAMDEIIEGTSQEKVDIYNKYSEMIYGKDEFEEVSDEEFQNFLNSSKNKDRFIFDYENCNDINKLKEHIKDLREMIIGLMEESDELDLYVAELEGKIKTLGGDV